METFNRGIQEGFYSCALIHLGNISYRLGRSLEFDPVRAEPPSPALWHEKVTGHVI